MKKNEEYKKEFLDETCLRVAIPLVKFTISWMSIEDVGDKKKGREVSFEPRDLGKCKLYMTNADKAKPDYVKLYIVGSGNVTVRSLYVKKDTLYPGERHHHVTLT